MNTQPSLYQVLGSLRRERRRDRIAHLRSIELDATWVDRAHAACGAPPLFANLRSGVWYVAPSARAGECYFKSTDGHTGRWDFSLTRLNLRFALAAAAHGGAIVCDATRAGKRFPDALSKTVPIWCCVINRALVRPPCALASDVPLEHGLPAAAGAVGCPTRFAGGWDTALHLPPWVPPSEAAQIEAHIGGWVDALCSPALAPVLSRLRAALDRPLRPGWLCPPADDDAAAHAYLHAYAARASATSADASARGAHFAWVHCVSASRVSAPAAARARASWTYIQGAADDEENWARGLRADQWWAWRARLLEAAKWSHENAEELLTELQASVDAGADADAGSGVGSGGGVTALWSSGLLLGPRAAVRDCDHADAVVDVGGALTREPGYDARVGWRPCDGGADGTPAAECATAHGTLLAGDVRVPALRVAVEDGKRAQPSKDWWQRVVFPTCLAFVRTHLARGRTVLLCCDAADDRAPVLAAAALLALYAPDCATPRTPAPPAGRRCATKEEVRARLALVHGASAAARVPRRLTKELNNFFVGEQCGWLTLDLEAGGGAEEQ